MRAKLRNGGLAGLRRYLATGTGPAAAYARRLRRAVRNVALPAPRWFVRPMLWVYLSGRAVYYFCVRVFFCEPLFKAYCTKYGRRLHTDVYVHWVQGAGDIILGDDVRFDGKSSITFAARFAERPTLLVGSRTTFGHGAKLTIGKQITVGSDCRIAAEAFIFDSSGHAADPVARKAGAPPRDDEVRPVTIEDNVWLGRGVTVFPGVRIGAGSIVSAASVVVTDVAPYTVVAGNPARKIGSLTRPADAAPALTVAARNISAPDPSSDPGRSSEPDHSPAAASATQP